LFDLTKDGFAISSIGAPLNHLLDSHGIYAPAQPDAMRIRLVRAAIAAATGRIDGK
jgi:hypothetical protein